MPRYLNELAPWERKKEYYHTIQLGKDVKEQTNVLNRQTKAMIVSQLASTNAIIASQERISESIDAVVCGVERVEQGIFELKSTFEWGISEVVWQIEQNRAVLRNILEVLMAPLDTQAKERRKRGEDAYANGWIEDAEEEFIESEKLNKFDFSIHISLGMIYLFHRINKEKALSYFEKAIKYSKPKSAFHASYALLHKALIHFDMGNTEEAEKASYESISLSPNFTEALYQNAQYNAQLLNTGKSIANLEKAIRSDKLYCLKANKDELFDPIRKNVNKLFEKLRDEEKKKARDSFAKLSEKHKASNPIITDISKEKFIDASAWVNKSNKLGNELKNLRGRIARDSYFDFIEINNKIAPSILKQSDGLVSELKQKIKSTLKNFEHNISGAKRKHENKLKEYLGNTGSAIVIGSFVVPAVMCLLVMEGWSKLWAIGFCVPIFSQLISGICLHAMITGDPGQPKGEFIVAWSLVIYLIASICFFFIAKVTSKGEMGSEIEKNKAILEAVSPYAERIKNI